MSALIESAEWCALKKHWAELESSHLLDLFEDDAQRASRFHLHAANIFLDYSKNHITEQTIELLLDLARFAKVEQWRDDMFAGKKINHTEDRAVLHMALRNRSQNPVLADGQDVMPMINKQLDKMRDFTQQVRDGRWQGFSGRHIEQVVNIGIGGSDLGPLMVVEALKPYAQANLAVHFVSNIDPAHIHDTLQKCDPETTLFIISSKSFSTIETLNNALAARQWFLKSANENDIAKHFVAVTSNAEAACKFGIAEDYQFEMWDWVGGRYSLWSSIGLPIALSIGMEQFEALLEGAHAMDQHFLTAPLEKNMPVLLAMLGIWYINFGGAQTQAILPYEQHLQYLSAYLQQADMESNGKQVDRQGKPVDYATGPIIWGAPGTNGQHAFFQLLHQGTHLVPADFIGTQSSLSPVAQQHEILLANFIAQMEALLKGKNEAQVMRELAEQQVPADLQQKLMPYLCFAGNKPSNALVLEALTPRALGSLLALYEHKIFVQGVVWNINSYDQWGVEYGKQLAKTVLEELIDKNHKTQHDQSTEALIQRFKSV